MTFQLRQMCDVIEFDKAGMRNGCRGIAGVLTNAREVEAADEDEGRYGYLAESRKGIGGNGRGAGVVRRQSAAVHLEEERACGSGDTTAVTWAVEPEMRFKPVHLFEIITRIGLVDRTVEFAGERFELWVWSTVDGGRDQNQRRHPLRT